jgi:hypothetical protein
MPTGAGTSISGHMLGPGYSPQTGPSSVAISAPWSGLGVAGVDEESLASRVGRKRGVGGTGWNGVGVAVEPAGATSK